MKLRHLPFAFLSSRSPEGLLIAAVLQLYSTHRIGNELEKEAKKL